MHYVKAKGILSSKNVLNIYHGCSYGCIYCDSRSKCYKMKHDFEDIEVKVNAITLLENKLSKKRKKCMIHLGSMSDPYIKEESKLKYTQQALQAIYKYGFGVTLITKSSLILRDLELLKKINNKTKCVVQMTLTTNDDNLCKEIEPNACVTSKRVKVLKQLAKFNIPTIVWLAPILPFINDTEENIRGILKSCIDANVYGIMCFGMGLTLRNGNREYFYENLDKLFPSLKNRHKKIYGNTYMAMSLKNKTLMRLFHKICHDNHILHDSKEIFKYLDYYEQKYLPSRPNIFDFINKGEHHENIHQQRRPKKRN